MALLPFKPDLDRPDPEPQVVGLDDDAEMLTALRSETARTILTTLHEEPATVSEIADRVDTSIQNAQYHLEKLHDADLVEIIDTGYSPKGREMKVYGPAGAPLALVIGDTESRESCQQALENLNPS